MLTFVYRPLALAPSFGYYIEDFHSTLADVVQFTGIAILVLGFSNFIWVPISTSFGRRVVYIASQLICLGSMVWRARAQTYGSFMGACVYVFRYLAIACSVTVALTFFKLERYWCWSS